MCALLYDIPRNSRDIETQWIKTPYGLRLQEDPAKAFKTLMEQEKFVMAQDINDSNKASINEWIKELEEETQTGVENKDKVAQGNIFYTKPNYTDTRVGGNDAINPYWQFSLDDDICPPILDQNLHDEGGNHVARMGRVYSETYDNNQQILWLCMGVPEYTNLISFYADAGNKNAAAAMNRGTLKGIAGTIINLVFSTAVHAITFPVMAPFWAARWLTKIASDRVTQYYSFRPSMTIYYELVNTMLSYLAVSMGLYPQILVRRRDSTKTLEGQYAQMQFGVDEKASNSTGEYMSDQEAMNARNKQQQEQATTKTGAGESDYPVYDYGTKTEKMTEGGERRFKEASEGAGQVANMDDGYAKVWKGDEGGESSYVDNNWNDPLSDKVAKKGTGNDSGIPDLLRHGVDIFSIINRRARLFQNRKELSTRQLLKMTMNQNQSTSDGTYFTSPNDVYVVDQKRNVKKLAEDKEGKGGWEKFWSSFKSNMFGAGDFVGFRIERGVSCTESVGNNTGPLGIAQKLNSYASEQREKYNNYGNSWIAKTIGELAKGNHQSFLANLGMQALGEAASMFGMGDIGAILTQGNGWVDIPEVWNGSSFDRSFSFNIQLNARYGDPVSIFQSIYIPMCLLLCAAMPRSIGNAMYTSPFLIKAFCKGFFSIPCGIISSLSFTRGKDEFGWSINMLPTQVNVSMTIRDMSPAFFLSMQDIGLFDTFSRNDKMMEYLDTLSALGIYERQCLYPKAIRKLTAALLIKKNTLFNSNYWGMRLGKSSMARAIAAVLPFGNYEKSDAEFQANN